MTTLDTHASGIDTQVGGSATSRGTRLGTIAGWFTTSDHKKIGRIYIDVALLAAVAVAVIAAILAFDRSATDTEIIDAGALTQFVSAYRVGLTFIVLLPLMVGIAVAVVPLQVGARALAFPRLAAAGLWAWLIGSGLVVMSIAANGGPGGGDQQMVAIFLSSHILLIVGLLASVVSVATTILTTRVPGMNMRRVPPFTWATLSSALGLIVVLPVLTGTLIYNYIDYRYGRAGFGGNKAIFEWVGFGFTQPVTFVYALPAFGFAIEGIVVAARRRLPMRGMVFAGLALIAAGALNGVVQNPAGLPDGILDGSFGDALKSLLPFALFSLLPLLGGAIVLGIGGLTLASGRPKINAPFVFGFLGAGMVFTGMLASALYHIGDLELEPVFEEAAWLYVAYGGLLAGLGAVTFWGPKLTGRLMGAKQTLPLAGLGLIATVLAALPLAIDGFIDEEQSIWSLISGVGHGLMALTVLAFLGLAIRSASSGEHAGDDPWDGQTLEWATSSPAPDDNFAELHTVTSAEPLLDLKPATAEGSPA